MSEEEIEEVVSEVPDEEPNPFDVNVSPDVQLSPPMGVKSAQDIYEVLKSCEAGTGGNLTVTEKDLIGLQIPIVPDLDRMILDIVDGNRGKLYMGSWHGTLSQNEALNRGWRADHIRCGTTHCRAGWAIALAGKAGFKIEEKFNPWIAGALIYWKSAGHIPDFFTSEKAALEDMRRRVGVGEP